jgi:hypothetical protein
LRGVELRFVEEMAYVADQALVGVDIAALPLRHWQA